MSVDRDQIKVKIKFYTELLKILNILIIATAAGTYSFVITGPTEDQNYNTFGVVGVCVVVGALIFAIFVYNLIQRLIKSLKTD